MTILELIITIALLGLLVWAITTLIPMDPKFKQVILVVAIVFAVLITLSALGLLPHWIHMRLT